MALVSGLQRDDDAAQAALAEGYGLALLCHAPGRLLADYHTAQVPPAQRGRRFATRAGELAAPALNTILSRRDYRTGAWHLGALWPRHDDARWTFEALAEAMQRPGFVPYLGRKSCPLGLPLAPRLAEAADPPAALLARHADGPEARLIEPRGQSFRLAFAGAGGAPGDRARCRGCRRRSATATHRDAAGPAAVAAALAVRPAGGSGAAGSRPVNRLWLSRARLRRDAPVSALARLLVPDAVGPRAAASHRLVWALFADGPERRRDFLWREEAPGRFMALSSRPPANLDDLFELEFKAFAPVLAAGDRLGFSLRANPVIARPAAPDQRGPDQRGKRHDVVMDALYRVPSGERAALRAEAVLTAGRAWLARQGTAHGFRPDDTVAVDGYETVRIPREAGAPARFGVVDVSGVLTVLDPPLFLAALASGFGRARAFGCGLMLIRRAR